MKTIEVHLTLSAEEKELRKTFEASELENKKVEDIIDFMLDEDWPDKDRLFARHIKKAIQKCDNYTLHHYSNKNKIAINYKSASLTSLIIDYEINGEIKIRMFCFTYF